MRVGEGYATKYRQSNVRMLARFAAKSIKELMDDSGADCVVVHGNSGVSCGFAALMYEDFPLILLRKDNDNSHGSPIEGPEGHVIRNYIILDDFIATGSTMNRVCDKISLLSAQSRQAHQPPVCVGIVLYGGETSNIFTFNNGYSVPIVARRR